VPIMCSCFIIDFKVMNEYVMGIEVMYEYVIGIVNLC